jgi:hypothetical protein
MELYTPLDARRTSVVQESKAKDPALALRRERRSFSVGMTGSVCAELRCLLGGWFRSTKFGEFLLCRPFVGSVE